MTYEPERPSSPIRLQPSTYQPYQPYQAPPSKSNHQRDESDTSTYSNQNRASTHQHNKSNSTDFSYNYSFPDNSNRNSAALTVSTKEPSRRPSASSSLNVPGASQNGAAQPQDPRLSEFYDAYYRHSQLVAPSKDSSKRPNQLNLTEPTIEEVPSPLPSPSPNAPLMQHHPGMAM